MSPRGGPPGFVTVLDDQHLAIPDATGNRRLDTLENIVSSGRVALIFLIPGRDTTLRVNGHAAVTAAPEVLDQHHAGGEAAEDGDRGQGRGGLHALPEGVRALEALGPGDLARSATLPTSAEVSLAHQRDPELTLEQVQERERDALANRLE